MEKPANPSAKQHQLVQAIRKWMNFEPFEGLLGCQVQEMDLSLGCQYTKKEVRRPARSQECDVGCIVEY